MNAAAIEKLFADAAAQNARYAPWPNNAVSTFIPEPEKPTTADDYDEDADDGEDAVGNKKLMPAAAKSIQGNALPLHGNQSTMNLNNMVHANVIQSPYYRHHLNDVKTYQEVVDEIYYHVKHLEPWERGSRRTEGQVGMCGSVRGVGAGGIVSSAFCLLYKLHVLKLTKKQLLGLLNFHKTDKSGRAGNSPYVRGIGFMYIRYTQPPTTLWEWFEVFMDDDEYVDPKAGGGDVMSIGGMIRNMLSKLDWYGTLFPRIPVPVQKQIDSRLEEWRRKERRGGGADKNTAVSSSSSSSRVRNRSRSRDRSDDGMRRKRRYEDDDAAASSREKRRIRENRSRSHSSSKRRRNQSPEITRKTDSSKRSSKSAERDKSVENRRSRGGDDYSRQSSSKHCNDRSDYGAGGRYEDNGRRHPRESGTRNESNGKHHHRSYRHHHSKHERKHHRRDRSSSEDRKEEKSSRGVRKD